MHLSPSGGFDACRRWRPFEAISLRGGWGAEREREGDQVQEEGWLPTHITIREDRSGALLGCCPLYLKGHSYGECVPQPLSPPRLLSPSVPQRSKKEAALKKSKFLSHVLNFADEQCSPLSKRTAELEHQECLLYIDQRTEMTLHTTAGEGDMCEQAGMREGATKGGGSNFPPQKAANNIQSVALAHNLMGRRRCRVTKSKFFGELKLA